MLVRKLCWLSPISTEVTHSTCGECVAFHCTVYDVRDKEKGRGCKRERFCFSREKEGGGKGERERERERRFPLSPWRKRNPIHCLLHPKLHFFKTVVGGGGVCSPLHLFNNTERLSDMYYPLLNYPVHSTPNELSQQGTTNTEGEVD